MREYEDQRASLGPSNGPVSFVLMRLFEKAEEISEMKVSLIATLFGLLLALGVPVTGFAGPLPPTNDDFDGDGIEDQFDNCSQHANILQADETHNGCGDVCTYGCDANGDGKVGLPDFQILIEEFGNECPEGSTTPTCKADCTQDAKVGLPDFQLLLAQFGSANGPSGITNAQCDPQTCGCTPAP